MYRIICNLETHKREASLPKVRIQNGCYLYCNAYLFFRNDTFLVESCTPSTYTATVQCLMTALLKVTAKWCHMPSWASSGIQSLMPVDAWLLVISEASTEPVRDMKSHLESLFTKESMPNLQILWICPFYIIHISSLFDFAKPARGSKAAWLLVISEASTEPVRDMKSYLGSLFTKESMPNL